LRHRINNPKILLRFLVSSLVCLSLIGFASAQAATSPKKAAPGTGAVAAQPGETAAPSAAPEQARSEEVVAGFRSALFGMNEADVRAAILKDFNLKGDAIKTEENVGEQTSGLVVQVPDLLQGGGKAEVSYIFGYKSKALIQVGVVWSKTSDETMTPARLYSNANILRAHFMGAGYKPETIATNASVAGGLLMFRGSDAKDHSTILILQGTTETRENNQRVLTPTALLLLYIADAKSPDVFRLPPGQF